MADGISGPVNAPRLKSIVERIERLEEERKAASSDIKDIYSEAKGVGYDTKTLRKVIAARKLDPSDREEQETLFETYMHALGDGVESAVRAVHAGALSIRAAAKATGVKRSTIHRAVPKEGRASKNGTPAHDADGVIIESENRGTEAPGGEEGTHDQVDVAGSLPASITGPEKASGPSRAEADIGASPSLSW